MFVLVNNQNLVISTNSYHIHLTKPHSLLFNYSPLLNSSLFCEIQSNDLKERLSLGSSQLEEEKVAVIQGED